MTFEVDQPAFDLRLSDLVDGTRIGRQRRRLIGSWLRKTAWMEESCHYFNVWINDETLHRQLHCFGESMLSKFFSKPRCYSTIIEIVAKIHFYCRIWFCLVTGSFLPKRENIWRLFGWNPGPLYPLLYGPASRALLRELLRVTFAIKAGVARSFMWQCQHWPFMHYRVAACSER